MWGTWTSTFTRCRSPFISLAWGLGVFVCRLYLWWGRWRGAGQGPELDRVLALHQVLVEALRSVGGGGSRSFPVFLHNRHGAPHLTVKCSQRTHTRWCSRINYCFREIGDIELGEWSREGVLRIGIRLKPFHFGQPDTNPFHETDPGSKNQPKSWKISKIIRTSFLFFLQKYYTYVRWTDINIYPNGINHRTGHFFGEKKNLFSRL